MYDCLECGYPLNWCPRCRGCACDCRCWLCAPARVHMSPDEYIAGNWRPIVTVQLATDAL